MKDTKMYFIYSPDGKEYEHTCYGIVELANFLDRTKENVKRTIARNKKNKTYHIKNKQGIKYTILSEDDMI